jgi:N-carbamoyl-L-amino-acid hydrolase
MIKANPERVLRDLHFLRGIGAFRTGVHRPTYSAEDMRTRHWLAEQLSALGHAAEIDGIGNVLGRSPAKGRIVLGGSHLETQNEAGWLDGVMGVVFALEAARAAVEAGAEGGVDVIAFADEEGHFGSFLGSRSAFGEVDEATLDAAADRTRGTPLRQALAAAGLAGRPRLRLDPARYAGFLEAHIEQGGSLEKDGLRLGIVTGIVGARTFRIACEGQQNHAGTTRMADRRDAGVSLRKVAARLEERAAALAGPITVWTIGVMRLDPGAQSVVPGFAEMLFQFRDTDARIVAAIEAMVRETVAEADAAGPCRVTLHGPSHASEPAAMDPALMAALEAAAEAHAPGMHVRMPSGAGHDAQIAAGHMPAAMLFVPSIGGISHHWSEDTAEADIALGAQVYVDAVARVLAGA